MTNATNPREWLEFASALEAYRHHYGDDSDLPEHERRTTEEQAREWLDDNTTVIELKNRAQAVTSIIVKEF